ncbi:dynein light chain Tctex-type protein 2B-like [Ptychodera flava]|uniref:dynein light chain Tctex-type protein 2B-like n=1 Tax=Ptychodera flava TaxID=63121 RepID=UPI00396A6F33
MSITKVTKQMKLLEGPPVHGSTTQKMFVENGNQSNSDETSRLRSLHNGSTSPRIFQRQESINGKRSSKRETASTEYCVSTENASMSGEGSIDGQSAGSKHGGPKLYSKKVKSSLSSRRKPISAMWRRSNITRAAINATKSNTRKVKDEHKMQPDEPRRFNVCQVAKLVQNVLDSELGTKQYDPATVASLTESLTTNILNKVKDLDFVRYKIIAQVSVSSNSGQGLRAVSRCIWNTDTDSFTSVSFQNNTMFVVATVYGVYCE